MSGIEAQPSARALEYAHDGRWPDDRIDLARLCEEYGDERAREGREAAIEEVVKRTSEQIAILGGVLLRNPCRDEILRTLMALNNDFRALAAKRSGR